MTTVNWSENQDIQPAGHTVKRDRLTPVLLELTRRPGVWAELGRYPMDRIRSARSRGSNIIKRYPGIEYAVLPEADDAVLYLRAAAETGDES